MSSLRCSTSLLAVALALLASPSRAAPSPAPADSAVPAGLEPARALASEGLLLYDANRFDEAIERFQRADALFPAQQYRVYLGRAYARLGKLATAARYYEQAATMPDTNAAGFMQARAVAAAELTALRPRVPKLVLQVAGPEGNEVKVTIDGVPRSASFPLDVPLDPGKHRVTVGAPGFAPRSEEVELIAGRTEPLLFVMERSLLDPIADELPPPPAATERDHVPRPPARATDRSHRMQLGTTLRADINPLGDRPGVVFAPGLSFGATHWLEVSASALLGNEKGVEPALTFYVLKGALKPRVDLGLPIFFTGEPLVGVRGGAGLQWDPLRHFGVFVEAAGAYFIHAEEGRPRAYFLPAVGVQARL